MNLQHLTVKNLKFPGWITPAILIISLLAVMILVDPFSSPANSGAFSSPCFIDTTAVIDELQKVMPDKNRVELNNLVIQEYSGFTRQLITKYNQ